MFVLLVGMSYEYRVEITSGGMMYITKTPWPIPTERPPLVSKVSANFCG
jgi:hypothetical protein